MGIFSTKSLESEVDSLDFDQNKSKSSNPVKFKHGKNNSSNYGIERAIILVSSLQKHNVSHKVIAGIMKQTLESVEVHFSDIIADAERKESEIKDSTARKDEHIQEFNKKLESLKQEKIQLQKQLDETMSVREFLQQVSQNKPIEKESKPKIPSQEDGKQLPANA